MHLQSIFPSIAANVMIHLGFIRLRRINFKYFIVEITIELAFILGAVLVVGYLAGWLQGTPVWVTSGWNQKHRITF